nr:cyclin-dependent kinase 12 isoform X2 [Ipomoea batatas]
MRNRRWLVFSEVDAQLLNQSQTKLSAGDRRCLTGILGRSKSLIKATRSRIEFGAGGERKRGRGFSREDLAKLLGNGLDINAYGRGSNSGRDIGSEIECFVNQKFVEQLASRTTAMEKRIQLLQDIASEFQIRDGIRLAFNRGWHLQRMWENFEPTGKNSHRQEREFSYADGIPLPKPRSVRRKHHKSSRNNDDAGNSEDARVVNRSNRRREHSKTGLQVLVDDRHHRRDDEERMIDKLLMHYSKKSSNYDIEKLRKKPETHGSHPRGSDTDKSSHERIRKDECEINSDVPPPPTRSISLPHEQATPSETKKVYMRANSFQPDNQARHVHPKLPDYEDLAAQFAALRGI